MRTARVSRTTTISLPPKLYRDTVRMAKEHGMTRSELFREALRRFRKEEQEWQDLAAYGRRKAQEAGIKTEEDVERVIDESRT